MKYLRPFFVLAILCLFTGTAVSQKVDLKFSRTNPEVLKAFRPVVAQPSEYTVRVQVDGKDAALGTIVESDGYILTKASEMSGKKITIKTKNGVEYEAKIVGKNDDYDLAMLKVDASGLPIVEWRDSKQASVGKWVASASVSENPVAVGVISVATRKLVLGDQPPRVALGPNSPYLGVALEPADGGVKVTNVNPGTPAFKAGLKKNDIVFELAGRPIVDVEDLQNAIQRLKINDNVLLKVKRGEEELELKATLGRPDPKMFNAQEFMGSQLSKRRGGFPFILQHDTVLKTQDCGGPLVDLDGKTVGINIARAGRTETYALPSEEVQKLVNDLKSGKVTVTKVTPPDPKKDPNVLLRANPTLGKKDMASKFRKGSFMKVHEVKLVAGSTYIIEMESNEIDSYLILEDDQGTKLAEDDDGAGFPNARIVFRAPVDGTYRVVATTFMPDETGGYTLTVRKEK